MSHVTLKTATCGAPSQPKTNADGLVPRRRALRLRHSADLPGRGAAEDARGLRGDPPKLGQTKAKQLAFSAKIGPGWANQSKKFWKWIQTIFMKPEPFLEVVWMIQFVCLPSLALHVVRWTKESSRFIFIAGLACWLTMATWLPWISKNGCNL